MKHVSLFFLSVFFLLVAACSGGQNAMAVDDNSTWMRGLADSLRLCKLSLPGTHDSGASTHGGVYLRTQDLNIATQLIQGNRCFDIRLQSTEEGKLGVYHSVSFQDIYWEENVLADFIAFLKKNPSEMLIVSLKKEGGESADYARLLSAVINTPSYQVYFVQDFRPDLTLGECRGKILFLHRDHVMDNYPGARCYNWADNATCTMDLRGANGEEAKVALQDEYQHSSAERSPYKVEVCNRNMDRVAAELEDSNLWGITFTSATAIPLSGPIHFADRVNEPVAKHIRGMNKKPCGLVLIDFAGSEHGQMLVDAIIANN